MDFPGYRAAIEQWIVDISGRYLPQGLRDSDIFWKSRPQGMKGKLWVEAQFIRNPRIGQDTIIYFDNPTPSPGQEIVPVLKGQRKVELQIEAHTFRAEDRYDAIELIDLLADSIRFPSVDYLLHDAGLGYETTISSPNLTRMVLGQDRELSAAQLRVRFHTIAVRADIATTYVDTVTIGSELRTPTGDLCQAQVDLTISRSP